MRNRPPRDLRAARESRTRRQNARKIHLVSMDRPVDPVTMRLILLLFCLWLTPVAATAAAHNSCPAGQTACGFNTCCRSGQTCSWDGCCIPLGGTYCGGGRSCPAGQLCSADGLRCEPFGTTRCGPGTCPPGSTCGRGGTCLRKGETRCDSLGTTCPAGTAACASVVAATRKGLVDRKATVRLDGGDLEVEWLADGTVQMAGPATLVYKGESTL